jgi:hypothetical protein
MNARERERESKRERERMREVTLMLRHFCSFLN